LYEEKKHFQNNSETHTAPIIDGYRYSFPEVRRPERDAEHFRLAMRLKMNEAITLLPHRPLWCGEARVYLYLSPLALQEKNDKTHTDLTASYEKCVQ
jgi:hypothetical protein